MNTEIEQLAQQLSAETIMSYEEALNTISELVSQQYAETQSPQNREQRRKLMRKVGKKNYNAFTEKLRQLWYIDKIQKLREINKGEKQNEATD